MGFDSIKIEARWQIYLSVDLFVLYDDYSLFSFSVF